MWQAVLPFILFYDLISDDTLTSQFTLQMSYQIFWSSFISNSLDLHILDLKFFTVSEYHPNAILFGKS